MPFRMLPTWFAKKPSVASPPKDRSQLRVGIPKVLNIWTTSQFWVGFLKALGVQSENIIFSSDTSEEQGREFGKGRGTTAARDERPRLPALGFVIAVCQ